MFLLEIINCIQIYTFLYQREISSWSKLALCCSSFVLIYCQSTLIEIANCKMQVESQVHVKYCDIAGVLIS